jgi:predicted metal-dependent hydrolase
MTVLNQIDRGIKASFPVRRMDFNFEHVDKYFYDGQPAMSMFMAAMQAYFPDGEQFFIDSVRHYRPQITDSQLDKDIGAFIGQEAMHGKEHRLVNVELLARGVNINPPIKHLNHVLDAVKRYAPNRFKLAITASLEHFTAVLGTAMLKNESFVEAFRDPGLHNLIRWHALEECEHKAVAFDTYMQIGGTYPERVIAMLIATLGIAIAFSSATSYLLYRDQQLGNIRSIAHLGKTLFGRRGLFRPTITEYLDWYRPKFHPNDHDTKALEQFWKVKLQLS